MNALSNLEQRALSAYYRAGTRAHAGMGQTSQPGAVETVEHEGLQYIRLTNVNGILAVYRVRIVNGEPVLKGLKRWPSALNA